MITRNSTKKTRSEQIRERREKETNTVKKVKPVVGVPVSQRAAPIISRGTQIGRPMIERTKNQNRSQLYIPLKEKGKNMAKHKFSIANPGIRVLSGIIMAAALVMIALIQFSATFVISSVEINGLSRLNQSDITAVVNNMGSNIFLVNPDQIKDTLYTSFPELSNIDISVQFPGNLVLHAQEKSPVIAWEFGNLTLWVDQEGNLFPPRGDASVTMTIISKTSLPRSYKTESDAGYQLGIENSDPINQTFIAQVLQLSQYVESQPVLTFTEDDGFVWYDPENQWNVHLGYRLDNLDQKLLVYRAIKDLLKENGERAVMISVANVHAPYYRSE